MAISMLLVAPNLNMAYHELGVQELVNAPGLDVHLVHLPCTTAAVEAAMRVVRRVDWLHIFGHGDGAGVRLDNEVWSGPEIVMACQALGAQLTWINSCSSVHLVKLLSERTRSDSVATLVEQPAQRAWQLPVRFAAELIGGKRAPADAFLQSAAVDMNSIYVRSLLR